MSASSVQRTWIAKFQLLLHRLQSRKNSPTYAATIAIVLIVCGSSYGGSSWLRNKKEEQARAQKLLRRNSRIRGLDGSRTLFVPSRSGSAAVVIHSTKPTTFDAHKRLFINPPRNEVLLSEQIVSAVSPGHVKSGMNTAFVSQFLALLNIMIPRWNCKESGLLLGEAAFLMFRTYLSLVVARLDGEIVRDLVAGNGKAFLLGILKWGGIGALASYINAGIKLLQSKVTIAFRTRLTRYFHDLYLDDALTYHKVILDGSIGEGIDSYISNDLNLFCTSAASLYASLGKPFVDLIVFNYQLYLSLGPLALTGLLANYFLTAVILKRLSPPSRKEVEARKESSFRTLHTRLIINAEEIAFYGGAKAEKLFLDASFKGLRSWMEGIYRLKLRYNMLEDFVLKYSWSAFGYVITALPVFVPAWGGLQTGLELGGSIEQYTRERGRMKDFITNKRLMLSLADAGGRIMYSLKDIHELSGYAARIFELAAALHRTRATAYAVPRGTRPEPYSLADVKGTLHTGYDGVRFESCSLVSPSPWPRRGDELLHSLSFVIQSGEHLLISGPNGVGKSAIARVVAGLWPVYRGLVSRPRRMCDELFFLPQRPLFSVGTLRDQIIYPQSDNETHDQQDSIDSKLLAILEDVRLGYLPDREGGWNGRNEWKNVLSGGEKQRMGFARLLYHKPRFAFIDEGTSAVSSDVEGLLYERAKERGITLITISTRVSLKKYHTFALHLGMDDTSPRHHMERVGTEHEKIGVERELRDLREMLAKVEGWKRRKVEVEEQLAQVWVRGELHSPALSAECAQSTEDVS